MDQDPTLFDDVQRRLVEARQRVQSMDLASAARSRALQRLSALEHASHFDLSLVSRAVAAFHADLDAGEIPVYD